MTKTCPNCKTENSDNAGFCQECGIELKGITIQKNLKKNLEHCRVGGISKVTEVK
jgi:hypothetical protein